MKLSVAELGQRCSPSKGRHALSKEWRSAIKKREPDLQLE